MNKAHIIIDLGFGDAGKGSVVDFFTKSSSSDLILRFNGGAQAAHNVVFGNIHHTFRQFGSGSFRGARTLYLKHALFDPLMFLEEGKVLESKGVVQPFDLFYVEENCVITTIFQQAMNRIRELVRAGGRHGSCGLGIGETASDKEDVPDLVLTVKDLKDWSLTRLKLKELRLYKLSEALRLCEGLDQCLLEEHLSVLTEEAYDGATADAYCAIAKMVHVISDEQSKEMLLRAESPIFEGAQGVLLDQEYGFYPHVTRSSVIPLDAVKICGEVGINFEITGLVRSYMVRHGAGPMSTYDTVLTNQVKEYHNKFGEWQGEFRVGYFDATLIRLAIDMCCESYGGQGVDNLFMTCTDRLSEFGEVQICDGYILQGQEATLSPYSLRKYGKNTKRKKTDMLNTVTPVYKKYNSSHKKDSWMYQRGYAEYVCSLLKRRVSLTGISRGIKAEDKYLL